MSAKITSGPISPTNVWDSPTANDIANFTPTIDYVYSFGPKCPFEALDIINF